MPRSRLMPLKTLWTEDQGEALPLPATLRRLYGRFRLPRAGSPPYIYSNFVTTLDGVVSLHVRGHANGGDISGFNAQDRMVMGLLRAVADVVIVGSGTLAADSQQVWTPEAICPELASEYARLRTALGRSGPPLNVITSGSGSLNLRLPVFSSGQVQVMIITTTTAQNAWRSSEFPTPSRFVRSVAARGRLRPARFATRFAPSAGSSECWWKEARDYWLISSRSGWCRSSS